MPKPLFSKLIVQVAIGLFCVLFGCIYGIHTSDKILMVLSRVIGICCLIRTVNLYQLIHSFQQRKHNLLIKRCHRKIIFKRHRFLFPICITYHVLRKMFHKIFHISFVNFVLIFSSTLLSKSILKCNSFCASSKFNICLQKYSRIIIAAKHCA